MTSLKNLFLCTGTSLKKWPVNPRIYAVAAALVVFTGWQLHGLTRYAHAAGFAVAPWVFPHILGYPIMILVDCSLIALMFSDAPFLDGHTPFVLIRTGRLHWVLGQLLYIIVAGLLYTLAYYLVTALLLIPNLQLTMDWGKILRTLALDSGSAAKYSISLEVFIDSNLVSKFSAVEATLLALGLHWLVTVFIGVLIFSLNLITRRSVGLIATGIFIFISYVCAYIGRMTLGMGVYYLSPLTWICASYLNWSYTGDYPSPTNAICALAAAILLLSLISAVSFCRRDISIQGGRS